MFKINFVFCRYGNKHNKKYNILMHDTIDHVPSIMTTQITKDAFLEQQGKGNDHTPFNHVFCGVCTQ